MTKNAKTSELFTEHDTDEQRRQITALIELRYPVVRKTKHHVKILEVNYYITTGTITIDPDVRYKNKGFEALLSLLQERYPRSSASLYY